MLNPYPVESTVHQGLLNPHRIESAPSQRLLNPNPEMVLNPTQLRLIESPPSQWLLNLTQLRIIEFHSHGLLNPTS